MPDTTLSRDDLQHIARCYRDTLGWSVIPIAAVGTGKRPPVGYRWKQFQDRLPSDAELDEGFRKPGVRGLAAIAGRVSGNLLIRDFDAANTYQSWAGEHVGLAGSLPTCKTARGYHVYARTAEPVATRLMRDGGHIKGEGGYCLLPPSLHPDGARYTWLTEPSESVPLVELGVFGVVPPGPFHSSNPSNPSIACITRDTETLIDEAIKGTLPAGPGQRNRCLFCLARKLRALTPMPRKDLEPIIQRWHELALPTIRTKCLQESLIDFFIAYGRVTVPHGSTVPAVAAADTDLERLAGLCVGLQARWPGRSFPLGAAWAAKMLGLDHPMQGWRLIRALVGDGRLELVRLGDRKSGRAGEYLYHGGNRI